MRKNWSYLLFSSIVFLLIIGGTMFLLLSSVPEYTEVLSSDGIVNISGLARESQPFKIEILDTVGSEVLLSSVYRLTPDKITLDQPAQIIVSPEDSANLFLYKYDEKLMMWSVVEDAIEYDGKIYLETDELGDFALGFDAGVNAPNFLTTYDELLAQAPENAVGFEMTIGIEEESGVMIEIPNTRITGGCGGDMHQGNSDEISILRKSARVLVEDVETLVDFSFVAHWLISSSYGCAEEENLEIYPNVIK